MLALRALPQPVIASLLADVLTTAGYRDILHIGRHQRPQHYSIMQEIPWQDRPLVRRRHRLPVRERTGLDFASRTPGVCHACGHDVHSTILYP